MTERSARSGAALAAAFLAVMLLSGCNPGAPSAMTPLASTAPAAGVPATTAPAAEAEAGAGAAPTSGPESADTTPCPTTGNTKRFAKIRFALHAGLALGAFQRYIYKPLRAGGFKAGAEKRKRTFVKAAVAGLFAIHELKVAKKFAEANPTLCRGVKAVSGTFASLTSKLKGGSATPEDLQAAQNAFGELQKQATSNGFGFKEKNVTVPGAG
ncbi:hypothetical protein AB0395_16540 [Streptosporangium sp. NPDC051023]|uniref:hypothetical protein n=1 Tax=Streptosporangium sp. NPDC051023 TaxID=3155410 RepID=UPI0034508DCD